MFKGIRSEKEFVHFYFFPASNTEKLTFTKIFFPVILCTPYFNRLTDQPGENNATKNGELSVCKNCFVFYSLGEFFSHTKFTSGQLFALLHSRISMRKKDSLKQKTSTMRPCSSNRIGTWSVLANKMF